MFNIRGVVVGITIYMVPYFLFTDQFIHVRRDIHVQDCAGFAQSIARHVITFRCETQEDSHIIRVARLADRHRAQDRWGWRSEYWLVLLGSEVHGSPPFHHRLYSRGMLGPILPERRGFTAHRVFRTRQPRDPPDRHHGRRQIIPLQMNA